MIKLEEKLLSEIKLILRDHVPQYEVRAYGSRVNGHAQKFSDVDLAIVGETEIDRHIVSAPKEAFAESNLPIMVDVLDWCAISDEFRNVIMEEYEVLQEAGVEHTLR